MPSVEFERIDFDKWDILMALWIGGFVISTVGSAAAAAYYLSGSKFDGVMTEFTIAAMVGVVVFGWLWRTSFQAARGFDDSQRGRKAPAVSEPSRSRSDQSSSRVFSAMLWMYLLSIIFFWIPIVGPLVAGIVGGHTARSIGAALNAALLPIIPFGILFYFVTSHLSGIPMIGVIAGLGAMAFWLLHCGPLVLGALIGGAIAK